MSELLQTLWINQQGQDIAEHGVILAMILLLVVGTVRLVGNNANTYFLPCRVQFTKQRASCWTKPNRAEAIELSS
jgi:Flp pilus assembly pilin Flp